MPNEPPDTPARPSSEPPTDRERGGVTSRESAPTSWEENPTFRETFLLYLPPDLHPSVREAGRTFFAVALETELPPLPRPWTHMRLRAVASDLRFLQSFLEAVALDRFEASLAEEEARLAERAEAWAVKLQRIARRIEEATA